MDNFAGFYNVMNQIIEELAIKRGESVENLIAKMAKSGHEAVKPHAQKPEGK